MVKKKDDETEVEFGAGVESEDTEVEVSGSDDIHVELTEKEKLALLAEAKREVAKDIKAAKMRDFKAAAKKRLQAEANFRSGKDDKGADLEEVHLHLASHPKFIILDGAVYHSGRTYKKSQKVAQVLREQMARGWRMEAARMGEREQTLASVRNPFGEAGLRYN